MYLKNALGFVWQIPQHVLAFLVYGYLKCLGNHITKEYYRGKTLYRFDKSWFGVALGQYIFLHNRCGLEAIAHEFGHCRQSMLFGPLYLIVIGIPSAVGNNLWDRVFHQAWPSKRRQQWYYSRYPERWADVLGGVVR
ncbi:MAG: hypothetical protein LBQ30_06455 [Treponema sp.]|jgi:hypothetical protein|nr:hypothetical protein [Treponema sp.]